MTIKYTSLYGLGSFSPPSCSTTTSSTHYSLSCSSSMNTSTTNVCSSKVNTLARDMLLSPHLARTEYNGLSSSRVVQSRARCRTPPVQPSVTCPGERGLTSAAALAVGAVPIGVPQHLHAQQTQNSRMELDQPTTIQKMDTWPEAFQDLRAWCHPDRDELNTPQITMQDEFNFSPDGPMNNWDIIIPSPVDINDHLINQDPLTSPNIHIVDEENNNYTVIQGNFSSYVEPDNVSKSSIGKVIDFNSSQMVMMPGSSALKMKGSDVLWSQAVRLEDNSPDVLMGGGLFDTKLNSSSSTAAKLGSGGKLVVKLEDSEEFRVPISAEVLAVPIDSLQLQQQPSLHLLKVPNRGKDEIEESCVPVKESVEPVPNAIQQQQSKPQPQRNRGKPRPKLKVNLPQQPNNSSSLATPDVLKPLTDISSSGFNLLQYVCGGGDNSRTQPTISSNEGTVTLQDHDYTEPAVDEGIFIKSEPLSPASYSAAPKSSSSRKRRRSLLDSEEEDESDTGSEWAPDLEEGRQGSSAGGSTGGRRGRVPSSGAESFEGPDRYRALRDRNNEASRRSRQNRKQRDMDLRKDKSELEKRNIVLRVKADKMEALVKEMRTTLLQLIKNSRNNSHNM